MAQRIAVLIPCLNEERSIAAVVRDFASALPSGVVFVYDNYSTDQSIARAQEAGAVVRRETLQGKGHTVRRMFREIEADIYILCGWRRHLRCDFGPGESRSPERRDFRLTGALVRLREDVRGRGRGLRD